MCACRYIAHKFEIGWEVGVIKAFDKKGPHAGKFSVKYKDDPNWWTHSLLRVVTDSKNLFIGQYDKLFEEYWLSPISYLSPYRG